MIILENKKLIFVGGKGGTGKTTTSSAISLHLSEQGHKILLFSTDPAHSLSDSFNIKINDYPTRITSTLDAIEINADKLMEEFKIDHRDAIQALFLRGTRLNKDEIDSAMDLAIPGIDEFIALTKLSFLVNKYDTIVVDTAPTGHTIRLLSMPSVVNNWAMLFLRLHNRYKNIIGMVIGERIHDSVDDLINSLSVSIYNIYTLMTDKEKTEFIIVTIPDLMAIEETKRLIISLYSAGIKVNNMVLNNIQTNLECDFCRSRRKHQDRYIKEIDNLYPTINKIYVPLYPEDINGMLSLRSFENILFE